MLKKITKILLSLFFYTIIFLFYNVYINRRLTLYDVVSKHIRPLPLLVKVNTRVMANYEGNGNWFPATIVAIHSESRTYNIQYDDGDYEEYVTRDSILVIWGDE